MLACFSCQTKRLIFPLFAKIASVFAVFGKFVTDINKFSLFHKPLLSSLNSDMCYYLLISVRPSPFQQILGSPSPRKGNTLR